MNDEKNRICPVELSSSLDSKIRRWLQNPKKILAPYISNGMKVLDVGCGTGYFSVEIAKMVGNSGMVFSVDLQDGMLQKLKKKIQNTELENRIQLIKCEQDKINLPEKVDFILAFYMVHEVPNKDIFFSTLKNILNKKGQFLIVEPKMFHVSKKEFELTMQKAGNAGFRIFEGPKLPLSFTSILRID